MKVTHKRGFRELTLDGWTEVENPDGTYTYTADPAGTSDAQVVWGPGDVQDHTDQPEGTTITYDPAKGTAKITTP